MIKRAEVMLELETDDMDIVHEATAQVVLNSGRYYFSPKQDARTP